MSKRTELTSIELFTGAGGLALGIARAGFKHLALVELNRNAVASLSANRAIVPEMQDWPAKLEPTDVKAFDFSPYHGKVTLLAAGAPCQPWSLGGRHNGMSDERNLFPSVFAAVAETQPEVVVIENVKGLLRRSFRDYFEYIELHLAFPASQIRVGESWMEHKSRLAGMRNNGKGDGLTYRVNHQLLNAADYGLPQRRERVFIVAFRSDLGLSWASDELSPTHSEDALYHDQFVSGDYWREHGLRAPTVPERLRERVARLASLDRGEIVTERWRTVRDAIRTLPAPVGKFETPTIANHVHNPGARQYPGHTGSPLDLPAKALKAGDHGVPGGENMLVNDDESVRYFTVREAARLQGFPDEYVVQGAWTEGFRQLGNAVPVRLAEVVAERIREKLRSLESSSKSRAATASGTKHERRVVASAS